MEELVLLGRGGWRPVVGRGSESFVKLVETAVRHREAGPHAGWEDGAHAVTAAKAPPATHLRNSCRRSVVGARAPRRRA